MGDPNQKPIRRCRECGTKSHRMYWEDDKCPVCNVMAPYVESAHGGLNLRQIEGARASLKKNVRKIEGGKILTEVAKERHY